MALFQLIEISQGRILLDGIDIRQVPLRILRSRLSAIAQDATMFSGTIRFVKIKKCFFTRALFSNCLFKKNLCSIYYRDNLDPLSEYDDEEIWHALELSQIKDVIASHPEGLSTQ